MSTQYTPGPWVFDDEEQAVTADSREGMAQIATVELGWTEPFETEQKANLALILAAPDLIEALKLADCLLSGANMNRTVVERTVRAAIAKATGATP